MHRWHKNAQECQYSSTMRLVGFGVVHSRIAPCAMSHMYIIPSASKPSEVGLFNISVTNCIKGTSNFSTCDEYDYCLCTRSARKMFCAVAERLCLPRGPCLCCRSHSQHYEFYPEGLHTQIAGHLHPRRDRIAVFLCRILL